jgi:hypothetical protein
MIFLIDFKIIVIIFSYYLTIINYKFIFIIMILINVPMFSQPLLEF